MLASARNDACYRIARTRIMASLSVTQAAKLTGRNRSTIIRAIEKGHLSAGKHEFGQYLIDPAELERVYGILRSADARNGSNHQDAPVSDDAHQRELELLRELLEAERTAHERTRADHDRERRTWDEERTFMRSMLDKHTEQVKLLTDERQQRDRHSPPLWARLWRRAS
jgi:excisionase family DNA binding protein